MPNTGFVVHTERAVEPLAEFVVRDMQFAGELSENAFLPAAKTRKNPTVRWNIPEGTDEQFVNGNRTYSVLLKFIDEASVSAFERLIVPAMKAQGVEITPEKDHVVALTSKNYGDIIGGFKDYIDKQRSIPRVLTGLTKAIAAKIAVNNGQEEHIKDLQIEAETDKDLRNPRILIRARNADAQLLADKVRDAIITSLHNIYLGVGLEHDGRITAYVVPQMMQSLNNCARKYHMTPVACPDTFDVSAMRA